MANPYPILTVLLPRCVIPDVVRLIEPLMQAERNKPHTMQQAEVVWQLETTLTVLQNAALRLENSTTTV